MNTDLKLRHRTAIRLLKQLGLDHVRLERENGHYTYQAWLVPLVDGNGSSRIVRHGKVKAKVR